MYFTNLFKDFTSLDRKLYKRCIDLPNGESPKICDTIFLKDNEEPDDNLAVILSGHKNGSTMIILAAGDSSYSVSIMGCNRIHSAVADLIVEEFKDYDTVEEAVSAIVSDFELDKGFLF